MADEIQQFIDHSRRLLTASYLPKIEACLDALPADKVWWRPNPESNSIGNLLLHLAGNVRQLIVTGIAGAPDERQRQAEFDAQGPLAPQDLVRRLRTAVEEADRVLAGVTPAMMAEGRRIRGRDMSILQAIYTVVEHFSMHTGQIILLTKMWVPVDFDQGVPSR